MLDTDILCHLSQGVSKFNKTNKGVLKRCWMGDL